MIAPMGSATWQARRWPLGQWWLRTVGYAIASLIGLAVVPMIFVALDHVVAIRWSNEIMDLVIGQYSKGG